VAKMSNVVLTTYKIHRDFKINCIAHLTVNTNLVIN
jgi:hypothetical protein